MMITMYIRPDQLRKFKETGKAYASTFRDSKSCFEIKIDLEDINLYTHDQGMPCDNYYISKKQ